MFLTTKDGSQSRVTCYVPDASKSTARHSIRRFKVPVIVLLEKDAKGVISPPIRNVPISDLVDDMYDTGKLRWIAKKWTAVAAK